MNRQEKTAKELLELTRELTEWNFQLTEYGGNYYVEALINNYTKGKIFTTFELKEKYVCPHYGRMPFYGHTAVFQRICHERNHFRN